MRNLPIGLDFRPSCKSNVVIARPAAPAGVKLTDFYANAMSCTPSRAGLIAGRYQQRYGIEFVLASPERVDRGVGDILQTLRAWAGAEHDRDLHQ
jgi:arylsulfatase A-like enzyme